MVYNPNTGVIASKNDLGNFTMNYGENGKLHALTSISGVSQDFPVSDLIVTYTDFKKVSSLMQSGNEYEISYGVDDQRRKSIYTEKQGVERYTYTRYYIGNYEETIDFLGNTKKFHYLSGGAILIIANGVETLYYSYSDYQGNLIALANEAVMS